jgi:hypothetical protein
MRTQECFRFIETESSDSERNCATAANYVKNPQIFQICWDPKGASKGRSSTLPEISFPRLGTPMIAICDVRLFADLHCASRAFSYLERS